MPDPPTSSQGPAYYPNGYNGPIVRGRELHMDHVEGTMTLDDLLNTDEYSQARKLVMEVFDDGTRERFVANIAGHLVYAPPFVRVSCCCDDMEIGRAHV